MAGFDGEGGQDGAAPQLDVASGEARRRAGPLDLDDQDGTWFPHQ
jgi:hypothetical protein